MKTEKGARGSAMRGEADHGGGRTNHFYKNIKHVNIKHVHRSKKRMVTRLP